MKKVFKIIGILFWIFMLFNVITWKQESFEYRELAGGLLNKAEITEEDLSIGNDYKTTTEMGSVESGDYYYKVRKLSGPEYLGQLKLNENEGVDITCTHGNAKILIMDEQGQQRFYAAVTELYVEPGGAGVYDVYLIGKKFTGEVTIEY